MFSNDIAVAMLVFQNKEMAAMNPPGIELYFYANTFFCCQSMAAGHVSENALFKDGAYYCYCAYVLRISRYSAFLSVVLTNAGIFLRGLKLIGESIT